MTYTVGKLVENRLYEITIVTGSRVGESRPSRIITVAPTAKSNVILCRTQRSALFIQAFLVFTISQVVLKW